jgi:hypothetical protein
MILFINFFPLLCNVILFLICIRIIYLVFELIDPDFQNIKHGKKIGLNILVFLSVFYFSGFYQFHFAYDINDYYSADVLAINQMIIKDVDSIDFAFQEIINNNYELIQDCKPKKKRDIQCCYFMREDFKDKYALYSLMTKDEISGVLFCSDSTFVINLGRLHSSDHSSFEEKHHYAAHYLIYHPEKLNNRFRPKSWFSHNGTIIETKDSILNSRMIYRIEKDWEFVW